MILIRVDWSSWQQYNFHSWVDVHVTTITCSICVKIVRTITCMFVVFCLHWTVDDNDNSLKQWHVLMAVSTLFASITYITLRTMVMSWYITIKQIINKRMYNCKNRSNHSYKRCLINRNDNYITIVACIEMKKQYIYIYLYNAGRRHGWMIVMNRISWWLVWTVHFFLFSSRSGEDAWWWQW